MAIIFALMSTLEFFMPENDPARGMFRLCNVVSIMACIMGIYVVFVKEEVKKNEAVVKELLLSNFKHMKNNGFTTIALDEDTEEEKEEANV